MKKSNVLLSILFMAHISQGVQLESEQRKNELLNFISESIRQEHREKKFKTFFASIKIYSAIKNPSDKEQYFRSVVSIVKEMLEMSRISVEYAPFKIMNEARIAAGMSLLAKNIASSSERRALQKLQCDYEGFIEIADKRIDAAALAEIHAEEVEAERRQAIEEERERLREIQRRELAERERLKKEAEERERQRKEAIRIAAERIQLPNFESKLTKFNAHIKLLNAMYHSQDKEGCFLSFLACVDDIIASNAAWFAHVGPFKPENDRRIAAGIDAINKEFLSLDQVRILRDVRYKLLGYIEIEGVKFKPACSMYLNNLTVKIKR